MAISKNTTGFEGFEWLVELEASAIFEINKLSSSSLSQPFPQPHFQDPGNEVVVFFFQAIVCGDVIFLVSQWYFLVWKVFILLYNSDWK